MAVNNQNTAQDDRFILTGLLGLYERVNRANLQELRFIAVNETNTLITYEQAALWETNTDIPNLTALSGVAQPDKNSAYAAYLKTLYKQQLSSLTQTKMIDIKTLDQDAQKFLPAQIICTPLLSSEGKKIGLLMFARKSPWRENETPLIEKISQIYAHEFESKQKKERSILYILHQLKTSKTRNIFLAGSAILMLFPFRVSVLAPAEIIPHSPDLIRAPVNGIIEDILVTPNQQVEKDDILIRFDQAALSAQKEISQNTLNTAQAELRQTAQEAMNSAQARARLSILQGKVEQEKTNLDYYESLIARSIIRAPKSGTVIFEDAYDWLGRPVSIGERIMLLADKDTTELEIRLPAHDAIPLENDATILFFSNARPDKPLKATLTFHSYRANQDEAGVISYRLKAQWLDALNTQEKRLGLKGTAKLYGPRRPLIWQILRIPLTEIRKQLGI